MRHALYIVSQNWSMAVPYILMSSYLYEFRPDLKTPLVDIEFDRLCLFTYRNWEKIEHYHKRYIERDGLKSGHPVWMCEGGYPLRTIRAAIQWSKEYD